MTAILTTITRIAPMNINVSISIIPKHYNTKQVECQV